MTASPLLLSSLSKYFTEHPSDARILQQLVDGTYPISLRIIDWFITHYSKMHNVLYWVLPDRIQETVPSQPSNARKIHLYYEYRAQLKSYTKQFFDPFRRHDRISFVIAQTPTRETIETTAGQLNFFRWAIQTRILDYIQAHLADIEEAMTQYQNQRKKTPPKPEKPVPPVVTASPKTVSLRAPTHQIRFD